MDFQHASRIADATTIKSHVDHLLFDARLISPLAVAELKTAFTGLTLVPLMAGCADSFSPDSVGLVTVAAKNGDSNHVVETKSLSLRHDRLLIIVRLLSEDIVRCVFELII